MEQKLIKYFGEKFYPLNYDKNNPLIYIAAANAYEKAGSKSKVIEYYEKACDNCGIISVKIDSKEHNILDVSSPLGYFIFLKLKEIIKNNYSSLIYKKICNEGDANIIRVLEKIEEKQGKKYLSYYDVVCAVYPKNIYEKKRRNPSDFYVGMQKQICIKNLSAIKEYGCIELKKNKEIEDIFNLIMQNRRNIKNDK